MTSTLKDLTESLRVVRLGRQILYSQKRQPDVELALKHPEVAVEAAAHDCSRALLAQHFANERLTLDEFTALLDMKLRDEHVWPLTPDPAEMNGNAPATADLVQLLGERHDRIWDALDAVRETLEGLVKTNDRTLTRLSILEHQATDG